MHRATVTVDKAGRLVLPKALRDRFRLRPGSRLEVHVHDDHVRLRPVDWGPALIKEDGFWVHQGAADSDDDLVDAVARHRRERLEDLGR